MPEPEGGYNDFKISELFISATGDVDLQQRDINGKGEWFINSGVQNFGIKGRTDRPAKIFPANTITIDFFGNAYYRPFKYKMATHNHVFSLSGEVIKNQSVGLYLVAQMSYLTKLFTFNNMGTWSKIKKLSISLPITHDGNIDYKFMEERMRELEEERMRELEAYLDVVGFKDCTLSEEEQSVLNQIETIEFKEKKIGEPDGVFDIATGRDIIIGKTNAGNIPLISHQHDNNGISKRISAILDRRIFNCNKTIPLADRGVFLATTQCENFHIGTRVKALTFKDGEKSEDIRLFFVATINKLQIKFTEYLTNATDSLPHLTIQLPVKNNDIDYEFMETYIRAIKKECIARLKAEINREQEVYSKVVSN